jgi:hypothetical protein
MLQFYYEFIDYYVDRSDFQYCIMDTDSAYFAISIGGCYKLHLRDEFQANKHTWLGRDDSLENKLYDSRTPGLLSWSIKGMA